MVSDDDMMSSTSTNHSEVDINSESHSSDGEESNLVVPISDLRPVISSGDLGCIMQLKSERKLSDSEIYFLLNNHFIPAKGYKFPTRNFNGQKRQFQMSWLNKYNGLTYSPSQDGGFCL